MHTLANYLISAYYPLCSRDKTLRTQSLPSRVEKPEWVIKIALVREMLQSKERPITEPQPSLK